MKFGWKERELMQHNIQPGNKYGNRVSRINLKVKINGTPMKDLIKPSP